MGRGRSLTPFAASSLTAVVATGAVAIGVSRGWWGPDVDRGANFCEVSSGVVRQPANTWSNGGFVVVGLLAGWRAGRAAGLGATMRGHPWIAALLACLVVLLGPAMHVTESARGGAVDVASMQLVGAFVASYAWFRARDLRGRRFVLLTVTVLGAALALCLAPWRVPVLLHPGNLAFALCLVAGAVGEWQVHRARRLTAGSWWGVSAVVVMAAAFGVWSAGQHGWCDPHSWLQAHAVWHLLCAVAVGLLCLHYWSEREAATSRNHTVSS